MLSGDQYLFTELVNKRKIPSKERAIFLDGLPPEFTEQDIRLFFTGTTKHIHKDLEKHSIHIFMC